MSAFVISISASYQYWMNKISKNKVSKLQRIQDELLVKTDITAVTSRKSDKDPNSESPAKSKGQKVAAHSQKTINPQQEQRYLRNLAREPLFAKVLSADMYKELLYDCGLELIHEYMCQSGLDSILIVDLEPIPFAVFVVKSSMYLTREAWLYDKQSALFMLKKMKDSFSVEAVEFLKSSEYELGEEIKALF